MHNYFYKTFHGNLVDVKLGFFIIIVSFVKWNKFDLMLLSRFPELFCLQEVQSNLSALPPPDAPEAPDVQHVRRGGRRPEAELARIRHHKDPQRAQPQVGRRSVR